MLSSDAPVSGSCAPAAWGPKGLITVTSFQTRVLRVRIEYSGSSFHSVSVSHILSFSLTGKSQALGTGLADNLLHQAFDVLLITRSREAMFHLTMETQVIGVNEGRLGAEIKCHGGGLGSRVPETPVQQQHRGLPSPPLPTASSKPPQV